MKVPGVGFGFLVFLLVAFGYSGYNLRASLIRRNEGDFHSKQHRAKEIKIKEKIMASKADRKSNYKSPAKSNDKAAPECIDQTFTDSDLIIGLVGAVGTELKKVVDILRERLNVFNYNEIKEIRISKDVIPKVVNVSLRSNCTEYTRIDTLMTSGDQARRESKDNSILALGAAACISSLRATSPEFESKPEFKPRRAYIINSLKHPAEVLQLRRIYPFGFYLFGVYSEEKRRQEYLAGNKQIPPKDAEKLMARDEDENIDFGQRVKDTFHMSDFFVHLDDSQDQLKNSLWRILDIMFGHPHITPTFDEYAMFLAHVAALRSASLSRQVGTVITKNNEIVATGANDCPKFGGGLYWPYFDKQDGKIKDEENGRDHMRGEDANRAQLEQIKLDIIREAKLPKKYIETLKNHLT